MKKRLLITFALFSAVAIAAPVPTSGTMNETTGPVSFKGGPFLAPNPTSDRVYLGDAEGRSTLACKKAAMNCDRFALTVSFSAKSRQNAIKQKQVLRFFMRLKEQEPLPLLKPDFHIYLFDAKGTELGNSFASITGADEEQLDLPLAAIPNGDYIVTVTGYNGLGASYSAEIGLARE